VRRSGLGTGAGDVLTTVIDMLQSIKARNGKRLGDQPEPELLRDGRLQFLLTMTKIAIKNYGYADCVPSPLQDRVGN
jgi:hypothetical protein